MLPTGQGTYTLHGHETVHVFIGAHSARLGFH